MTNSTDQERKAFEAAFPVPQGIAWNGKEYATSGRQEVSMFVHLCRVAAAYDKMHAVWQARAQQPAIVAVPEGIAYSIKRLLQSLARESDDYAEASWARLKDTGEQSAELEDLAQNHAARAKYLRELADGIADAHRAQQAKE